MIEDDVIVRYIPLPRKVNAVTVVDDDGYHNVYINSLLSYNEQTRALKHELCHIKRNHLFNKLNIKQCEKTASDEARPIY
ncbi:MAG: hypothetical protein HFE63_11055 [Clostridiales bacterium]|nr:hypothetical protein [Clostridiales bacterium]